ncbi:MAG: NUDIX domain-containing protein [Magnetococcus sp. MYC-9]
MNGSSSVVIRPAGVVVRDRHLLVMCYRYGARDRFNLPGGNLEAGEELTTCLMREFAEELDLEITVGELLFCAETVAAERHVLHLVFRVATAAGQPCLNPAQTRAVQLRWLPLAEVAQAPLYPALAPALADWLMGEGPATPGYLGRLQQEWLS